MSNSGANHPVNMITLRFRQWRTGRKKQPWKIIILEALSIPTAFYIIYNVYIYSGPREISTVTRMQNDRQRRCEAQFSALCAGMPQSSQLPTIELYET